MILKFLRHVRTTSLFLEKEVETRSLDSLESDLKNSFIVPELPARSSNRHLCYFSDDYFNDCMQTRGGASLPRIFLCSDTSSDDYCYDIGVMSASVDVMSASVMTTKLSQTYE